MRIVIEHPSSGSKWIGEPIGEGEASFEQLCDFIKNISDAPTYVKMTINGDVLFFQQSLIRECVITIQK